MYLEWLFTHEFYSIEYGQLLEKYPYKIKGKDTQSWDISQHVDL